MIKFSCSCGKPFEVIEDHVGKKIRCRFCGEISVVPPPSDPRASGHLEQLDWRLLDRVPVADKLCLHCGTTVEVAAKMCPTCGEVFGWTDKEETPEVTREVTDEIEQEPVAPELTQSGRFKHISDIDDAPAQFELVEFTSQPSPVELDLLQLPPAKKPITDDAEENRPNKAIQASEPPADNVITPPSADKVEPTPDTGTFEIDGIIDEEFEDDKDKEEEEDEEEEKEKPSRKLIAPRRSKRLSERHKRSSEKRKRSSDRQRRDSGRSSRRNRRDRGDR
jgi:phage FluMu protein Com